jgi:fumarate hydratase subunit alpha
MRDISAADITDAIERMAVKISYHLGKEELNALCEAGRREESPIGRAVLGEIVENARIAGEGVFPLCQDTGLMVVFVDWGQDAHLVGGDLQAAVDEGVRRAQKAAYLRTSVLADPIGRRNTGDNTPAIVHVLMVQGDRVRLVVAAKGGGSENMSRLAMLKPSDGADGVVHFAVETMRQASGNPCPPVIMGVGVGGNFEKVALLAKRALLRPLGEPNPQPEAAEIERRILAGVNNTGVGPAGLGGRVTALAVHVEMAACHIASLPVAVNIDCHAHRHAEETL